MNMNRKLVRTVLAALAAATLAGMAGCCWMKCPCKPDCHAAQPCAATDRTPRRNVDMNVGAHAGTSGVGLEAGLDRK